MSSNTACSLATRLPQLVQDAGFELVSHTPFMLPMGLPCRTELGPFGQSLHQEEECTLAMAFVLIEVLTRLGVRDGYLESQDGKAVADEEGRLVVEEELKASIRKNGAFTFWASVVAGRPAL